MFPLPVEHVGGEVGMMHLITTDDEPECVGDEAEMWLLIATDDEPE